MYSTELDSGYLEMNTFYETKLWYRYVQLICSLIRVTKQESLSYALTLKNAFVFYSEDSWWEITIFPLWYQIFYENSDKTKW